MARNVYVLLVGRDKEFLANLGHSLNHDTTVVGEASLGVEAVRLAQQSHPDAVVVHVEEPAIRALHTLESIAVAAPKTTLLVVSSNRSAEAIRRAMRSGANDYLLLPFKSGELDRAIAAARDRTQRRLAALQGQPLPPIAGTIVTVFGPKGGIGKTTLATNLSLALRTYAEVQVCIVDMDAFFGDVSVTLDIRPQVTVSDYLRAVRADQQPRLEEFLHEHETGLMVLPSPGTIGATPIPNPDETVQILTRLGQMFDYVIVDTPGAYTSSVGAALDTSTMVLLVTSPDLASVKDVRLALDLLNSWDFAPDRVKLTLNHPTRHSSISERDLERALGHPIFWSVPFDKDVVVANQSGVPVILRHPSSKASQSIIALTAALSGIHPSLPDDRTKRRSLFPWVQRLIHRQEVAFHG